MSSYAPKPQPWHQALPMAECTCGPEWSGRGLVDDTCYHHRLIDAVEELVLAGWMVMHPDGPRRWIRIKEPPSVHHVITGYNDPPVEWDRPASLEFRLGDE